jgi:hypothetical protein
VLYAAGNPTSGLDVSNLGQGAATSENEEDRSVRALLVAMGALALLAGDTPASAGGAEFSFGPGNTSTRATIIAATVTAPIATSCAKPACTRKSSAKRAAATAAAIVRSAADR